MIKFFLSCFFVPPGPEESEDEEPLLSGSGEFERSYSEGEMANWAEVLSKWKDLNTRPNKLTQIVRRVCTICPKISITQNLISGPILYIIILLYYHS